ncbi:MAG TPA: DUF4097 family beta strand repeat-containing protein [Gemmatimonadales bacterium]
MKRSASLALLALLALLAGGWSGGGLVAQERERVEEWLRACRDHESRYARHCEIREYTLPAGASALRVDAGPNGSIHVAAHEGREVRVIAKVQVQARSESDVQEMAEDVRVEIDGRSIRSTGPRMQGRRSWAVSYDVYSPGSTDLSLSSTNGSLTVEGITGDLDLETTNGSIRLGGVAGTVRAETTNGSIAAVLGGNRWSGRELDLETTNGGIRLTVPEGFSADLDASTTNGGIEVDFPVTVRGRISRQISGKLGDGGPPIRLRTTNGGIAIRKA